MNKAQLQQRATDAGAEWDEGMTNAQLATAIAHAEQDGQVLGDPSNVFDDGQIPVGVQAPDQFTVDSWHPAALDPEHDDNGHLSSSASDDGGASMWRHRIDPDDGVILTPAEVVATGPAQSDEAVYLRILGMHREADALGPYQDRLRTESG